MCKKKSKNIIYLLNCSDIGVTNYERKILIYKNLKIDWGNEV